MCKFSNEYSQNLSQPYKHIYSEVDCFVDNSSTDALERCQDLLRKQILEQENDLFFSLLKKSKTKKFTKLSQELFNSVVTSGIFYVNRELITDLISLEFFHICTDRVKILTGYLAQTETGNDIVCYPSIGIKESIEDSTMYFIPFDAVTIKFSKLHSFPTPSKLYSSSFVENKFDKLLMGWRLSSNVHIDIDTSKIICYKRK